MLGGNEAGRKGVKILVVDDEFMIRDSLRQLLEHCGCEVEAVDNGEAALDRLAQRSFDLVITDFAMPGMQGDQLVLHIRETLPNQHVIMVTAFVEDYKVFGQPSGSVDALLFKPFTFKELRDTIEQVLASDLDESEIHPVIETDPPKRRFNRQPES